MSAYVSEKLYIVKFAMMECKFAEEHVEDMVFLIILDFQIL